MTDLLLIAGGIALFIAGVYTGMYLARHTHEIVTTEKLVTVEKPVVVQVPANQPVKPQPSGPSFPVIGSNRSTVITNAAEREQAAHIEALMNANPEA